MRSSANSERLKRLRRERPTQVERVSFVVRTHQAIRDAWRGLSVLKWRLAARAVARGAKVGAALHRLLYVLYMYSSPHARTYFGQRVLGLIFHVAFQVFKASFRIGQLHSEFLRLEFEAVQLLHLGKAHG